MVIGDDDDGHSFLCVQLTSGQWDASWQNWSLDVRYFQELTVSFSLIKLTNNDYENKLHKSLNSIFKSVRSLVPLRASLRLYISSQIETDIHTYIER